MKIRYQLSLAALAGLALIAARPNDQARGKGGRGGGAAVEPAVVPSYPFNVWLCRPGANSVTASVIAWSPMEAYISYGESEAALTQRTATIQLLSGEPKSLVLEKLKPDTSYVYQLNYRHVGGEAQHDKLCHFHTQRAPASAFTFTIQADSHLDVSTDSKVYEQTIANERADNPDFMVDLGDTMMVDKFGSAYTNAESQYLAQRYYMGQVAHSTPVFLTLGNHDGEVGSRLTGQPDSMPLFSVNMRKKFFPNPEPGGIYTGNAKPQEGAGLLQDYYAWEWGGALLVVLDPFWYTRERKGSDNWGMTLGDDQYQWLTKTLENSKAPFKFIFVHHLVGGVGRDARGGVNTAPFMEWGGKNADGSDGFAQHRPNWKMPIHQLFVKNGVSAVFHGHDHLFAKEELDGIVYQDVPQPSNPSGGTRSAEEYGYTGVILGSSGHLRVTVDPKQATVEYVRASVPGLTRERGENGSIAHRYTLAPRP
mgnify:CR=1 FL=1